MSERERERERERVRAEGGMEGKRVIIGIIIFYFQVNNNKLTCLDPAIAQLVNLQVLYVN